MLSGKVNMSIRNSLQPCHEVRKYMVQFVTSGAARWKKYKNKIARPLSAKKWKKIYTQKSILLSAKERENI